MQLLLFVSASAPRKIVYVFSLGYWRVGEGTGKKHNLHTKQSTTFIFTLRKNLSLFVVSCLVLCSK